MAAWAKLTGEPATVPLARFVRVVTRGEHHELRRAVIEALGSTRSAAAIAPLQAVIAEGYPSNTRAAATALGTTERAEGLDALQRLFQSQPQLAISAAVGLGRGLAAPWIESIISEAKLQKDADLEEAAQRALRQLRE
ncbi:MAG: HEAT repeat domain-containing protein [Polyangiaceae bacterium]|nr:HEAT repeat domain-containing protein [Polyangiaceae bacterium]